MAQDGTTAGGSSYTIDNVTFPVGRTKLQSIFDAIRSTNIGNTAPDLVAGQFWIDNNTPSTTIWTLYFYDGTDNISFATIDTINNTVNFLDSTFDLINDSTPQLGGTLDSNGNNIDMGTNLITDTKVGQWDTAYSWGDHSTEGYITASSTDTLINKSGNISQWTNDAGYLTSETDSQTLSFSNPNLTISNGNSVDLSALDTGILNVVEDTTPQLGGDLDLNSSDVTGTGNVNITGTITSTGDITTSGVLNSIAPTRHSIRPSLNLDFANSKVLDPRITFTRGSNATYYDGYTSVKAEENGIYPSTNLSSSPQSAGVILTHNVSGISAPDGTETTSYFVPSASSGLHYSRASGGISSPSLNTPYTGSFFAKANGYDFVVVQLTSGTSSGGSRYAITVDLTNGTIGGYIDTENVSNVSSTATSVGNGWYRITLTASFNTANSSPLAILYVVGAYSDNLSSVNPATTGNATPSFTGDGSSGVYVWGFQVEQRDSLTAYTATTSSPITKYQPALQTAGNNVARFDHNPTTGESLGLLIEESRTNTQVYSEEFDNGAWLKLRSSITSNTIISPDGTLTADKLVENTDTNNHQVQDGFSQVSGTSYTLSVYAKAGEREAISINSGGAGATFNLLNGNVNYITTGFSFQDAKAEDVGNGWYRCSFSYTSVSTSSTSFRICLANSATHSTNAQQSYTGDGYSGAYIWGAQLEQGSFPTSYIKTEGSQVTRSNENVDMNNIDTSDWFKQGEGTLFLKGLKYNQDSGWFVGLHDGTLNNRVTIIDNPSLNGSRYTVRKDNVTYFDSYPNQSVSKGDYLNTIISYKRDDFSATANGLSNVTDTSGIVPIIDTLTIGRRWDIGINRLSSTIKKISFYPIALTDNEIIDLTEE